MLKQFLIWLEFFFFGGFEFPTVTSKYPLGEIKPIFPYWGGLLVMLVSYGGQEYTMVDHYIT
jgi:hypothetical protein